MSPVNRRLRYLVVGGALLAALVAGCSKKHGTPFDPDSGHPGDYISKHGASFSANSGSCMECHGSDLKGGVSKVSCYSASRGEQGCHEAGPGGHGEGWSAAGSHGAIAKGTPGAASGMAYCKKCHGGDFNGGTAGTSCFGCHGLKAPHPKAPWRSSLTHTTTAADNASVCADCHKKGSGRPGCFNNTVCHGAVADHADGWSSASSHGAASKGAPGNMSGFAACKVCHGSSFTGGSSGQSCLSCHGWNAPHGKTGWDGGGSSHRSTDTGNASVCADCHQSASGTPGCYNSTLCHGASANHPSGWSSGNQHGATAKSAPGSSSGMLYCEGCHGSGLNGGSSGQSCLVNSGCHGWSAPHARSGWDGGGSSHRSTNTGNASVCAQCHQSASGTPGCFNSTLCHGASANHPAGWSAGSQHGATAKAAPGSTSGMLYCEGCHGSGLNGGSSGQSCLVNSGCHGWSAPHARSGWNGGGSSHRSADTGNATVCAQCHQSAGGTPGCFNSTLCHGAKD